MDNKPQPRRPGAPRGNLNAFKHGRRSRRLAEAAAALATIPTVAQSFIEYSRKLQGKQMDKEKAGAIYFAHMLQLSFDVGSGKIPDPAFLENLQAQMRRLGVEPLPPERLKKSRRRPRKNNAALNETPKHLTVQQPPKTDTPAPPSDTDLAPTAKNIGPNNSETATTAANNPAADTNPAPQIADCTSLQT